MSTQLQIEKQRSFSFERTTNTRIIDAQNLMFDFIILEPSLLILIHRKKTIQFIEQIQIIKFKAFLNEQANIRFD